jgi:hypothetical protein
MRRRVQVKRRPRGVGWRVAAVLPLDPRDCEVVRAKAMLRVKAREAGR